MVGLGKRRDVVGVEGRRLQERGSERGRGDENENRSQPKSNQVLTFILDVLRGQCTSQKAFTVLFELIFFKLWEGRWSTLQATGNYLEEPGAQKGQPSSVLSEAETQAQVSRSME